MPLSHDVFDALSARLNERTDDLTLFLESGADFEEWLVWEAYAACRRRGWIVQPKVSYSEVGLMGSREQADLLIIDPATDQRVLIELAVVSDWTTNRWIAALNRDTDNLSKSLNADITPMQIIMAASLVSPVEINKTWKTWLEMAGIWKHPTDLENALPLGTSGQSLMRGWVYEAVDEDED